MWSKLVVAAIVCLSLRSPCSAAESSPELRDVVGCAHVGGRYSLTKGDYLNEGADQTLALGERVIRVELSGSASKRYSFNSEWTKAGSLVEIAKSKYFTDLFKKPFTTYLLVTYLPDRPEDYYLDGLSKDETSHESAEVYELAKYLLTEYTGTGKTFVIQNREADWAFTTPEALREPTSTAAKAMADWLNARQDGVAKARAEIGGKSNVKVMNAAEVNLVARSMSGRGFAVNSVVPKTHCDLYSYAAWDTAQGDQAKFRAALEYLKSKAPDSPLCGENNIYVGEYGAPENGVGGPDAQARLVKAATETALTFGAKYVVYWGVYCNESSSKLGAKRAANSTYRGFWLVRPDGTKAKVCSYFHELVDPK